MLRAVDFYDEIFSSDLPEEDKNLAWSIVCELEDAQTLYDVVDAIDYELDPFWVPEAQRKRVSKFLRKVLDHAGKPRPLKRPPIRGNQKPS